MTDEQLRDPPREFIGKRHEERFRVPPVYQRYITLRVKSAGEFKRCALGDFSRSGILFISPSAFEACSRAQCVITTPSLLSREVAFGVHVKYCLAKEGSFFVGAEIDTVADRMWFDIFSEIHDFIVERHDVY